MTFGEWLRSELERRGWTMSDLARAAGQSPSTVNRWVRDVRLPDESSCQRIAMALGVPVDVVLNRAGHEHFIGSREAELEAEIATLEHQLARDYQAVEELEERVHQLHQELELLRESSVTAASPVDRVLESIREVKMPRKLRYEIEKRITQALAESKDT